MKLSLSFRASIFIAGFCRMRFFRSLLLLAALLLVCVIKHEAKKSERRTAKWTAALTITYFTLYKLPATVGRFDGCGNLITLPFNEATSATNKNKQLMSRYTRTRDTHEHWMLSRYFLHYL